MECLGLFQLVGQFSEYWNLQNYFKYNILFSHECKSHKLNELHKLFFYLIQFIEYIKRAELMKQIEIVKELK